MHALRSNGDQPRGFVKVLRDETGRREAEDALRLAKDAAEQANRTKDEFLATVSHELRTPVSAVLLWTNLLLSGHASPEQIAEGLKAVKSSAEAQRELINDLMDSSRISAGKLRIQLRLTVLADLVKSAVETILPTATIKGVNVVANLSPDAGSVMADPDRLQQVMWNLLTNAVKFTPTGGRVDVILQRSRSGVEIRVIDNGSGIAPEFLPHVFEAFRQGEGSTTRIHGGLGLGLAITKQLVELHGGTVRAESAGPGKGSTFIVSLPLAAVGVSRPRQRTIREAAAATPGEPVSLSGLRTMLLEDDPDTRNALMLILRSAGAEVVAFESVAPAMEAVKGTPPDVIVSDIGLPGEDGFSFMRRLRKQEASSGKPPVPAIALTAFSRDQDRQQAAESGFQAYLGKPVKEEELLATIREVARRK
jgi:CheY-like chemotaxis protein